jgi:hypothetical protein
LLILKVVCKLTFVPFSYNKLSKGYNRSKKKIFLILVIIFNSYNSYNDSALDFVCCNKAHNSSLYNLYIIGRHQGKENTFYTVFKI